VDLKNQADMKSLADFKNQADMKSLADLKNQAGMKSLADLKNFLLSLAHCFCFFSTRSCSSSLFFAGTFLA